MKFEMPGVVGNLPVFYNNLKRRQIFLMSREKNQNISFSEWKATAKTILLDSLMNQPPQKDFEMEVVSQEDRGDYIAKKILINITIDSRICGYLLIPKGKEPFPAVLLNHDHGGMFQIGKEKVIRPFNVLTSKMELAQNWVNECYGGKYIGDELCKRGYVCFCFDALNWGDRYGGYFEGQQAIASNLLHLGSSFAGLIAYEDMFAAEFLNSLKFVDGKRIGTLGLSMGAFRSWQLAALSEHISTAIAICWMATIDGIITYSNNQTVGHSSYTMLHPGLSRFLDYPDVASLACPKPMLFYAGIQDTLFPYDSIVSAYNKMHKVWEEQKASDKLVTKFWDAPHEFSSKMQEEAFDFLDYHLK